MGAGCCVPQRAQAIYLDQRFNRVVAFDEAPAEEDVPAALHVSKREDRAIGRLLADLGGDGTISGEDIGVDIVSPNSPEEVLTPRVDQSIPSPVRQVTPDKHRSSIASPAVLTPPRGGLRRHPSPSPSDDRSARVPPPPPCTQRRTSPSRRRSQHSVTFQRNVERLDHEVKQLGGLDTCGQLDRLMDGDHGAALYVGVRSADVGLHYSAQSIPTEGTWHAEDMPEFSEEEGGANAAVLAPVVWGRLVPVQGDHGAALTETKFVFGRNRACDLTVRNPLISTEHFTVHLLDRCTRTVELENHSPNGTFVNGEVLSAGGRRFLQHGDTIQYYVAAEAGGRRHKKEKALAPGFVFLLSDGSDTASPKEEVPRLEQLMVPDDRHKELRKRSDSSRLSSSGVPYKIAGDLLGRGGFGQVYLGMNRATGELLAVKQMPLSGLVRPDAVGQLQQEVDLLASLRHGNIVRYVGADRTPDHFVILMEFVPGGSILTLLKKFGAFSEQVIRSYMVQILAGLRFLHHNDVIHADVKCANILVTQDGRAKVSDFGAACKQSLNSEDERRGVQGTFAWMAPEVARERKYTTSGDVWSLGCALVEMASARPPWHERKFDHELVLFNFLRSNSTELPELPHRLSTDCRSFALCMLRLDHQARLNCDQLLEHGFITTRRDVEHTSESTHRDDVLSESSWHVTAPPSECAMSECSK
eukprot:TRINITY_DN20191_c0_g1_i1.p1 TRINITY_DN20191_c0_g1~~TRINITY_DN20191_c0_g1_i1.p1  ORF type:complete len:747 (+),score=167.34 TRINITY_DN20191_c0_g1_i1:145-2241(+)